MEDLNRLQGGTYLRGTAKPSICRQSSRVATTFVTIAANGETPPKTVPFSLLWQEADKQSGQGNDILPRKVL